MADSQEAIDNRVGQIPPPDGVTPDFDNPRDAGRTLNIVGLAICCALITVFFFIRAYVRIFVNRRILLSDVACFFGWVLTLMYCGTAFTMTYYGVGYHAWEVTPDNYTKVLKWLYASSVVYIPAAYFVKVTILLLIARVFAVEERIAKGVHIFILALLFAYTPVQTIKIMICTPIKAYWDPSIPTIGCVNQRRLFITDLVLAVVADLVIVLVPVPVTWSMRLPMKKKLKIIFMLGAGGLATGVTIFRLVKVVLFLDAEDVTADFVALDLTTCIELTIGLVCACLPSTHFLYERYKTKRRNRSKSNRPRTGRFDAPEHGASTSWLSTMTRKTMRTAHLTTKDDATVTKMAANDRHSTTMTVALDDNGAAAAEGISRTCCRYGTAQSSCCDEIRRNAQRTFDLELARFTGEAVDVEEGTCGGGSDCALNMTRSRVNSVEGRREGWLAPRSEGGDTTDVEAAGAHRPVRYWSTIWDGHTDAIPT